MKSMFLPASGLRLPTGPGKMTKFRTPGLRPERADLVNVLRCWVRRVRERRELGALTARDLRDIGVSPSDARAEMAKPFWRG